MSCCDPVRFPFPQVKYFSPRLLLLDALEVLYDFRSVWDFSNRLFATLKQIYNDHPYTFEFFEFADGPTFRLTCALNSDPPSRRSEVISREHPAFPLIVAGDCEPFQHIEKVAPSFLYGTELSENRPDLVRMKYQLILPIRGGLSTAAVIVSRGDIQFSAAEVAFARPLRRHFSLAYETALLHEKASATQPSLDKHEASILCQQGLSPREADVVWWMAQGKRDREIGVILGISHRTVQRHVSNVFAKLGVETRTAAVATLAHLLQAQDLDQGGVAPKLGNPTHSVKRGFGR